MSTSSTPLSDPRSRFTTIPVIAVCVSFVPESRGKRLTDGNLHIGPTKHKLISKDGVLSQQFLGRLEISTETRILLHYKSSGFSVGKTTLTVDTRRLIESFTRSRSQELWVEQGSIRVVFSLASQDDGPLLPTTDAILRNHSRFRILVIGKTGVGKSSLINLAFGISKTAAAHLQRGKADIDVGLESPVNPRFILHDSVGFEPGDKGNYDTVKEFIKRRQSCLPEDQLHAVWFCIRAPQGGERLLEAAAEDFFKSKKKMMGSIPLIAVFTKFDEVVDDQEIQLVKTNDQYLDQQNITQCAEEKAKSIIQAGYDEIVQLAGEPLPYAAVSANQNYRHTLRYLVELTHSQVGASDMPEAHIASVVTLMAQRIDPDLKIHGSITVGKQKYWKALRASPEFAGHTIWDCLSVIHADIIAVWNFHDPACHLLDKEFKELIIKMVQRTDLPQTQGPGGLLALGASGGSLVAGITSVAGFITNPLAPIVLPVIAGLALAVWAHSVYQKAKNVQQIFMAFIVDLTHVMETLFILTARDHNRLTRRAIKIAYNAYFESDVMGQAHARIREYRDIDGRDAALDMIESLIVPERSSTSDVKDYYDEVGQLDLQKMNLDQEEDW